jgi:hypothetical protein
LKILTAIYDLEVSPITFDITKFLLLAEQYKNEHNYSDLNVLIVAPSRSRLANLIERYSNFSDEMIGLEFFENRIEKLFEPLITLTIDQANWQYVGDRDSLEKYFLHGHIFPANYSISDPVAAYGIDCLIDLLNKGGVLPSLYTDEKQELSVERYLAQFNLLPSKTLLVFLRQTPYETWRNSDVASWTSFANTRIMEGYQVVWFSDAESGNDRLLSDLPGVLCDNEDILFRAAFVSRCAASFFVNGGTATLARYNHQAVSATFKLIEKNSPATSKQFWANKGIAYGQQLRFLSPIHHNEWQQDRAEVIEQVWLENIKPKLRLSTEQRAVLVDEWKKSVKVQSSQRKIDIVTELPHDCAVYIWGSGELAKQAENKMEQQGIIINGFLDSFKYGEPNQETSYLHPNQLDTDTTKKKYIVVATGTSQTSQQFMHIVDYYRRVGRFSCQLIDYSCMKFKH